MYTDPISRREFLKVGVGTTTALVSLPLFGVGRVLFDEPAIVAIAKMKDDKVGYAVEKAIDLLGGVKAVAKGKSKILLKPNLVADSPLCTTKPEVVKTLVRLMKEAGKEVVIGEGSAAAGGFNANEGEVFRTTNREILDKMQVHVFDQLGYSDLGRTMHVPLVNLHSGELVNVGVPGGHAFKSITLHRTLVETDMVCSVPMMKTHVLATVTLGMKNLIGLYPGTAYCSVRSCVHEQAATAGSPGIAYEILDMVKANKLGLVVVDGSMAMEGNGPTGGSLVKMGVIVAGTNPLATDMVAARLMGFRSQDVPTFVVAHKDGMKPTSIDEIEIRGERIRAVERKFARPNVITWESISHLWGVKEI